MSTEYEKLVKEFGEAFEIFAGDSMTCDTTRDEFLEIYCGAYDSKGGFELQTGEKISDDDPFTSDYWGEYDTAGHYHVYRMCY